MWRAGENNNSEINLFWCRGLGHDVVVDGNARVGKGSARPGKLERLGGSVKLVVRHGGGNRPFFVPVLGRAVLDDVEADLMHGRQWDLPKLGLDPLCTERCEGKAELERVVATVVVIHGIRYAGGHGPVAFWFCGPDLAGARMRVWAELKYFKRFYFEPPALVQLKNDPAVARVARYTGLLLTAGPINL